MSLRVGVLVALSGTMLACADLPAVEMDTCGNGVLEPDRGEDCDVDDGTCGAPGDVAECRLLCFPGGDPTGCPDESACGRDGVCRRPTGTFTVTRETPWTSPWLLVGEATNDPYLDLIGVSDQAIDVRLGSADATYQAQVLLPNLTTTARPLLSDLDGDAVADLTVPVGIGMYSLLGNPTSVLQPVFQSSFPLQTVGAVTAAAVPFVDPAGHPDAEFLIAFGIAMGPDCGDLGGCAAFLLGDGAVAIPDGQTLDRLTRDVIPWAWLPGPLGNTIVTVLAFRDDPETGLDEGGVYLFRGRPDLGTLTLVGELTMPGQVKDGAWFADVDGDGRSDLVVSIDTPGNPALAVAWGKTDGSFDPATILIGGGGPSRLNTNAIQWVDVDNDDRADLITGSGVVALNNCLGRLCSFAPALISPRTWSEATVGDFNGDGRKDVAAHGDGAMVDILYGTQYRDIFNEAPIAIVGQVATLRAGDFDGNGLDDLAIVTSREGEDLSDDLFITFGQVLQPLIAPTYMGYVGTLLAIDRTQAPVPGQIDAIDDLVLISERGSGFRGGALLLGSTSQRMVAPLIPTAEADRFSVVEAVVALPLDDDGTDDIICMVNEVAVDAIPGSDEVASRIHAYTSSGDASLVPRTPHAGIALPAPGFYMAGASWVGMAAQGSTPAMIAGADLLGALVVVPISCDETTCTTGEVQALAAAGELGVPLALHTADLDSDGDLDLYGAWASVGNLAAPTRQVMVWLNDDGFTDAQIIDAPAGLVVVDVAAIDLEVDGAAELLLVGRDDPEVDTASVPGLYLARFTGDTLGAAEPWAGAYGLDLDLTTGVTLIADDLDGDGLPDLTLVSGLERTAPHNLKVLVQLEDRFGDVVIQTDPL